ncbi:MAG: MMPL family transporter [Pseudomonadota bacterium]
MSDATQKSTAEKILAAIEPLIYARRKLTMGILLALTVFFAWQAALIKRDAGFDKSIPLDHPYMQVLKQYQDDFGGANTVLVALIQKDGKGDIYNERFLTALKKATDEVFFLPGIDRARVSSIFTPDVRFIEVVEGGFKGGNVIPAEYAPTDEMFQLVRENVGKGGHVGRYTTKDQQGAMIFSELLEVDPVTGKKLDYEVAANLLEDNLRGRFGSEKKFSLKLKQDTATLKAGETVGERFSAPGATFRFATVDTGKKDENGVPILVKGADVELVEEANPDYNPDVDVHILGFAKVVGDVITATGEVVGFFILTLFMTFFLLWAYTGSIRLAWLPLATSIVAVIWEFGLLRLFGFGLDPFAILVPFLILAVSVSHGVQYVNAWIGEIHDNHRNSFDASLETWRRLAIYGTMAIMTDVFGFATIYLVPIDIIREMSINATLGMLAIIITNKVMMPIWLTWVKIGDIEAFVKKQEARDSIFDGFWNLLSNMTRPVPAVTALMLCSALLGWSLWKGQELQVGDSQAGVPELLPDSRYNQDTAAVVKNFSIGTDVLKIIAETDSEACIKHDVMDQIDRFGWRLENTEGVASVISLPWAARTVNAAFSEAYPKWKVLPRNRYAMVQSITPIPTSSGLLNPECSAMAVFTFMKDHKAATIKRATHAVEAFNEENARLWYAENPSADVAYCASKAESRRAVGVSKEHLRRAVEKLRKKGATDSAIDANESIVAMRAALDTQKEEFKKLDQPCPVNFALASANVGVMAATNEEVHRLEKPILLYVYIAIVFCVWVSFREIASIICIMAPLALVSWMAYAVMAVLDIGMKVATLPVVALAVGIGVDYGIYVYATMADAVAGGYKLKEAYFKTLKMTGKAVIFTGITLGFGVATWLWSGLQFQRDMGKLLVFMFTANMFGAILVLPAIARYLLKERELAPGEKPVFKPRH